MSDWNDAVYEYYDKCTAGGMSDEEAEEALKQKISSILGYVPSNLMNPGSPPEVKRETSNE